MRGSGGSGHWCRRARRRVGIRLRTDCPAGPTVRAAAGPRGGLLDFRPILRNRSALAYSVAYCVHTWEMSALRGWVVTFLTFAAARTPGAWTPLAPATVASVMGLVGVWASVWGTSSPFDSVAAASSWARCSPRARWRR